MTIIEHVTTRYLCVDSVNRNLAHQFVLSTHCADLYAPTMRLTGGTWFDPDHRFTVANWIEVSYSHDALMESYYETALAAFTRHLSLGVAAEGKEFVIDGQAIVGRTGKRKTAQILPFARAQC